jgi:hypothetical protein
MIQAAGGRGDVSPEAEPRAISSAFFLSTSYLKIKRGYIKRGYATKSNVK